MDVRSLSLVVVSILFAILFLAAAEAPLMRIKRLIQEFKRSSETADGSDTSGLPKHGSRSLSSRFFRSPFGGLILILYYIFLCFLVGVSIELILVIVAGVTITRGMIGVLLTFFALKRVSSFYMELRKTYRQVSGEKPLYDVLIEEHRRRQDHVESHSEKKRQLTDALKELRFEYMSGHITRNEYEEQEKKLLESLEVIESEIIPHDGSS